MSWDTLGCRAKTATRLERQVLRAAIICRRKNDAVRRRFRQTEAVAVGSSTMGCRVVDPMKTCAIKNASTRGVRCARAVLSTSQRAPSSQFGDSHRGPCRFRRGSIRRTKQGLPSPDPLRTANPVRGTGACHLLPARTTKPVADQSRSRPRQGSSCCLNQLGTRPGTNRRRTDGTSSEIR